MVAIPVTSGLQLLLDARVITGLNDGDAVASWADSSGNSNNASQATAANRPIYKTNIYGTNPAVRQDTASKIIGGALSTWTGGTGATMFAVCSNIPASPSGSAQYFGIAPTGGTDSSNFLLGVGSLFQFWVNGANRNPTISFSSIGGRIPVIFGGAVDSSRIDTIINGLWRDNFSHSFSLPSTTQNLFSTGFIGSGVITPGFSAVTDYHFLIAYNRRLTSAEIMQVCKWIREELGIDAASGTSRPISPFTQGVIG